MGMEIEQYDIVLVDLNMVGSSDRSDAAIRKIRPCVVISPEALNRYLKTMVVILMTTKPKAYPTRVRIRHNQKTGWIVVDQIRTIDRNRVKRRLGNLTNPEIRKLKNTIRETYVE